MLLELLLIHALPTLRMLYLKVKMRSLYFECIIVEMHSMIVEF